MNFRIGDTVLAETIDGKVLCTVLGYNEMGAVELEPSNPGAVGWGKCWLRPASLKLVKPGKLLRSVEEL